MTIDPADLPDGTVVETRYGQLMFTSHGGTRFTGTREAIGDDGKVIHGGGEGWVVRTFSPDPTPDQEVPREEWASIKPGSRVRTERPDGVTVIGVVSHADSEDFLIGDAPSHGVDLRHIARVYLLDQPADPDADLVQAVADALSDYDGTPDFSWEDMARAALAVVRKADQ